MWPTCRRPLGCLPPTLCRCPHCPLVRLPCCVQVLLLQQCSQPYGPPAVTDQQPAGFLARPTPLADCSSSPASDAPSPDPSAADGCAAWTSDPASERRAALLLALMARCGAGARVARRRLHLVCQLALAGAS